MVSLLFTYESVSGALARRGPAGSQFPEKGSTVSNAEAWLFGCSERLTLGGGGGACLERTAIIATQRQTGGISVSGQLNLNL